MTKFNLQRSDILGEARRWLGTPYQHQASVRGVGTDCLGLVRGIWREVIGTEPMPIPPYTTDWGETSREETLLKAAKTCFRPMPRTAARPGDVILFRMRADTPCKHIAVLSSANTTIHAYQGRAVHESYLVPYWQKRWMHSFAFPGLDMPVPIRPHRVNDVYPAPGFDDSYKQFAARGF